MHFPPLWLVLITSQELALRRNDLKSLPRRLPHEQRPAWQRTPQLSQRLQHPKRRNWLLVHLAAGEIIAADMLRRHWRPSVHLRHDSSRRLAGCDFVRTDLRRTRGSTLFLDPKTRASAPKGREWARNRQRGLRGQITGEIGVRRTWCSAPAVTAAMPFPPFPILPPGSCAQMTAIIFWIARNG